MISQNESGRSLIEMLAVISIISMITVGAISAMNYGMVSYRANSTYTLVESTAQRAMSLYSWARDYSGFKGTDICANEVFDVKESDCEPKERSAKAPSPFGDITITQNGDYALKITVVGVPNSACETLKGMSWQNVKMEANNCDKGNSENGNELTFVID